LYLRDAGGGTLKSYRLDLLYKWSSGKGFIVTPRNKIKWEENYAGDMKKVQENESYLLVNLFYNVDERGRVVNTGFSINTNSSDKEMIEEIKRVIKTCWIEYPDSPESLNYRIAGILSTFTGIKEWKFLEGS
jgi:hypothetical protein